ncbi:uncharacterized protein [Solanum tuberosum]|uniref:uncharacterized protein isoform X3 n=1 Tax=Solanum tuberosum TaxID=4113 RepID=UPI00073A52B4|nr:PREDICTED: uncharacterized protein LOC102594974 isoform X3 [Solanum tuberosum]
MSFSMDIFPPNLRKVTLSFTFIPWEVMDLLADLPNLEVLKGYDAFKGTEWILNENVVFRKLKYLPILDADLKRWEAHSDNFPMLEQLILHRFRVLQEIPDSIGEIMTLKFIEIKNCGPTVVSSANKIQQDQESWGNYDLQVQITPKLITISEISSKSTQCILKVRVVRMWLSNRYKSGIPLSIQLVLQDEKGDHISASIVGSAVKYLKDKIQELGLYEMNNFIVANFTTSTHKHRLIFTQNTIVTEISDALFHMNIFNLRTFDQLTTQHNVDEAVLFDVIGQVVTYGPIQIDEKAENTRCNMTVVLEDDKKNRLCTTLFDELTDQIRPHLCGSANEPLIIVLQLVKAFKFRENYYVHSCRQSKLWINPNLPQPTDFKNRLVASSGSKHERIFQTNSQHISDELSKGIVPFKFLSDLIECTKESAYWIAAKIVCLKLDHGWSYLACNICFTRVDQEGNKYYCSECNKEVKYVIHRYNLQMYVMDGTAFISLFLLNREALQLVGKSAKELNEGLLEDVECSYPSELDDLIEKKFMFKVRNKELNIKGKDLSYEVVRFTDDETLLKTYCHPSIQDILNDSSFDYGQSSDRDKHFEFNTISEISSKSMQWILKVRVIRMLIVPDKHKSKLPFSLELILQDEKGDRIHASIGKFIIKCFKDKIQELGLYQMEYFVVAANCAKLKSSKHKHRLIFTKNTIVTELHDSLFHMNIFNLRTFDQLTNQENMDETELFDVVGQVVSYKPYKFSKEEDNDDCFFKVILEDDKKDRLSTILWSKHAYQIQPHLCESADEPLIVVLQLMMGHKIRENYYVHSCWDETKLWINSNLPQPTDFKNRLVASCGPKFERIFQTNPQQYIWDELSKGIVPFKFLSDLIQCTEESAYWIAAKVVYLKLDHGWSYLACNKCFTEVDQEENIYYCSKCNEEVISIIHRYDLQMYVTDGTAIISLLLGNREALQLIGKPAKELNEGLLENVECSYPSELDDLIEKKLMFKVRNKESNISKNDDVYKVIEFTNDETLLKKYCQPSIQVTLNDSSFDYGQSYGGDKHFKFNTISEISNKSMQWILKVRVIRMYWMVPDKYMPKLPLSLQLILQDEKGDRIHASIGKFIIKCFKDKIQELGLYQMEYFVVAANYFGRKSTKHKHSLIFTKNTIVTELHDSLFHMNIFNLRTFDQLTNQENMDETELFDVVGQVVSYKPFKTNKEGDNDKRLFKVVLEDDKKNRLSTILWGKHAYQIQPHLCESADEPLIVVMQLMQVRKLRENYYVHSCWDETKLWINSNLPQPTDFKNRLVASCGPKFEMIFQTNPQQYIWDELSKGIVPFKFLSDLIQCTEESAYWIAAKVVYLKIDHGWSHSACKKCLTVVDQVENRYYCSKCNKEVISIIHRYNLQMYVTDGTAFISLLFLNREVFQLIEKPAKELNEGLLENVECSYPSELDDLIEKKLMFKVMIEESNISKKDDVYKVIEFTNDETLLKKYCQPSIQVTLNDSSFDYGQSYGGDKHFEEIGLDEVKRDNN